MRTSNAPAKDNYSALLMSGVILLIISQALESNDSDFAQLMRGVCIGLSMVSCGLGLYLFGKK